MYRRCHLWGLGPMLAIALLCHARLAPAAEFPGMYAVTIPGADAQQSTQEALGTVLVRLTGQREAASDAALASLVANARLYTQLVRSTTGGATQVMFDGAKLRAAVIAAGRTIWDLDRPLLLVLLPPSSASEELHARLLAAAQARGVPIIIADATGAIAAAGSAAGAPGRDELLAAARRGGASAALLGAASAEPSTLQWVLAAPAAAGNWVGAPETAIDGAVDALVRSAQDSESLPAVELECQIGGVVDLPAFAAVLGLASTGPGVTAVAVDKAEGDTLSLRLRARGSAVSVARSLAGEHLLATGDAAAGVAEYRYQP
ncbi:MAG: DUF2066 domain-containing protein [Steroidobacterales bacterium]